VGNDISILLIFDYSILHDFISSDLGLIEVEDCMEAKEGVDKYHSNLVIIIQIIVLFTIDSIASTLYLSTDPSKDITWATIMPIISRVCTNKSQRALIRFLLITFSLDSFFFCIRTESLLFLPNIYLFKNSYRFFKGYLKTQYQNFSKASELLRIPQLKKGLVLLVDLGGNDG
jgi:hypothetical protein